MAGLLIGVVAGCLALTFGAFLLAGPVGMWLAAAGLCFLLATT